MHYLNEYDLSFHTEGTELILIRVIIGDKTLYYDTIGKQFDFEFDKSAPKESVNVPAITKEINHKLKYWNQDGFFYKTIGSKWNVRDYQEYKMKYFIVYFKNVKHSVFTVGSKNNIKIVIYDTNSIKKYLNVDSLYMREYDELWDLYWFLNRYPNLKNIYTINKIKQISEFCELNKINYQFIKE